MINFTKFGTRIPPGTIMLWYGTFFNVPVGWVICNGSNGTPNLEGKFVLCPDGITVNPGDTGGASTHLHSGDVSMKALGLNAGSDVAGGGAYNEDLSAHNHTLQLEYANNMPPYHALIYIMKL